MIHFIVSAFDRPDLLRVCLASLSIQNCAKHITVLDNSPEALNQPVWLECNTNFNSEVGYRNTACEIPSTCYHPVAGKGNGWLCFPSDDSYYVPKFAEIMLRTAEANNWDFVYCDMLYDPRLAMSVHGQKDTYSVMDVQPSMGRIDKTCFIIRRAAFDRVGGWPEHPQDWRDGALADAVVAAGIPRGKAPGIMVVHN